MKSSKELWWESLYAPTHFIDSILESIENKESVFIKNKKKIPWRSFFKSVLYNRILDQVTGSIDMMDATEIDSSFTFIHYLFSRFNIESKYKSDKISINQMNLIESKLDQFKIMILDCSEQMLEGIDYFFNHYQNQDSKLTFIILTSNHDLDCETKTLDYDEFITSFDQLNLIKLTCRKKEYNQYQCSYISELASRIYASDLEAACDFAQGYKIGSNKIDESNKKYYWEAELQVYFPLIEQIKQDYIDTYYEELQNLIPYQDQYRNVFEKVEEFELAQIRIFLIDKSIIDKGRDLDRVQFLYEFRNKLAHMKIVEEEALLDKRLYR